MFLKYFDLTDFIKKEFDIKMYVVVKYKDFDNDFIIIIFCMDLWFVLMNFVVMVEYRVKESGEKVEISILVI